MSYENVPTRKLMNMLESERHFGCSICGSWDCISEEEIAAHKQNMQELKEELDKREHIPNKKEAILVRKQKLIASKNKKNKRYVNRR